MTTSYSSLLTSCIDGEWLPQGNRALRPVINPSTGAILGELPEVMPDDLDRALDAADRGFRTWRSTHVDDRAAILHKTADILRTRVDLIATVIATEQGKPIAQARGEALAGIRFFDIHAEEARRAYGRVLVRPSGQRATVSYEPVGPSVGFAPWNFPFFNVARKIAPALAAGCSIISKPAEETPASAILIQQALFEAGLPVDASQLVFGDPDLISRHLIASPAIRKISFTGSGPVGKHLMKLAADGMKRTTMELGGHAPVLLFDDADIEKALGLLVPGKFRNSGQVCVSPTRFYVQQGIYDRFAKAFAERTAQSIIMGNPLDNKTVMGPLANSRRPDAVGDLIDDALRHGARALHGGKRVDGKGYFHQPTVLADVPETARIMNEEPFGPVALLRPFAKVDEAIEQANRLPFGLAAYVFTQNLGTAMRASDAIEAGMVGVNTVGLSTGDAPFGGVKESGHGLEDGPEGLKAFMVSKSIHMM
ncbi:MAG: NAD-dependent succinate-semialdehyde dehydrogenase [Alphaproteobacteria bacterium]|nr:NAD-dependent succinate-semialdehyde dehydrogenase [Alphaproteobacteria bacterium]MBU0863774.1 NAD-dependent succinate-semialdehyde dehydrogenase [Alphaproteobacteria bacterium]MBU1825026.1 NAD-dependent succinate-semialdehyde dehydrogenase [Alphaproteobacteria bacterium]